MNVASVMVRGVLTCRGESSPGEAAKIMWESHCGSVPVVDGEGRAVGMITDRDICMAAYTRDLPPSQMIVSSVCSRALVALREGDSVEAAERLMQRHQVRRLPVIDQAGAPVGMLSLSDLARTLRSSRQRVDFNAESVVATLAAIGTPRGAYRDDAAEPRAPRAP